MKPFEVQTADVEEMECELHSKEFFVQVGMLILEGRTPQQSDRGRVEGKHCSPLTGRVCHTCDEKNQECKEAITWTQTMESHWQRTSPLVIDVLVQLDEETEQLILLEQWTIRLLCSASGPSTSGSQLLQAVRSHIHFSQLSAWLSSSKGALPYEIKYRINQQAEPPTYTFFREPVEHSFPLASLPSQYSLRVMVRSLPRCTIQELTELQAVPQTSSLSSSNGSDASTSENSSATSWFCDARSPLRKRTCLNKVENGQVFTQEKPPTNSSLLETSKDLSSACGSKKSVKGINLEKEILKSGTTGDFLPRNSRKSLNEETKLEIDREFLNLGATSSNHKPISESSGTSNGISNLSDRIEKLGREIENIDRSVNGHAYHYEQHISGLRSLLKQESKECTTEKISNVPERTEKEKRTSRDMAKMVLQRKCRSLSDRGVRVESLRNSETTQREVNENTLEQRVCNTKQPPTRQGTASNSSDVDIHAIRQPVNRDCTFRRSVQLPFSACTEPVFNPKTGLPISSSPAPLRRSTNELYEDTTDFTNGLANKIDYRELSKLLSRSAPASTTQSLLVNFEESVLNGRMEPVGTVEGFTAELSASGSFCPRHVKLPIISCFYRLSDDDAPSPYMGYISLKDDPIGRRGYHVPRKGTIQLTVFNPNMTVVKMFVVLYDYSDMPSKSQTFLRQKTYSALKGTDIKNEAQQTLHYLLHLRFASSKSGKIYLHTDIRVIFARQPPDLGNIYQLYTITDGPSNPKYTKRHHSSEEPEC